MAFTRSVYLGLSFQLLNSELVVSVCQNVITSEYQNFCCVKILDRCVEILDGKFLCKQFFSFNILLQTIFLVFFSVQAIFKMTFDILPGNLLMVRPLHGLIPLINMQKLHF